MIDIDRCNKVFDEYVSNFDMSNEKISLKYYHTYRVCDRALEISKSLNLNEEDTKLSYLIALLHDIGRFEQIKKYNTFNDDESMDHATIACNILFNDGLIRKFIDSDKYDKVIKDAISNHNKYEIGSVSDDSITQCKIIRDADKLDILYNAAIIGLIKIKTDNIDISDEVKEDFNNKKSVQKIHRKVKNDALMVMLTFMYDLNYSYSFKYIKDNRLLDLIYEKVEYKEIFDKYFKELNKLIDRKCNNG